MKYDITVVLAKHISELNEILRRYGVESKSALISAAEEDIVFQRALLMSVGYIGELSKKLDGDIKSGNPHIHWRRLSNSRNIIFHEYDIVDVEIISNVVFSDIRKLEDVLKEQKNGCRNGERSP
ncbi:MAG: DUF86 domain-containing protein [Oscillospiraceae bacterium]|nr:DUF86 domain-containing protein [Oscillospiraceae bacterium]